MIDDDVWEDWAYRLDKLCRELTEARLKAGKAHRALEKDSNLDLDCIALVQKHIRSALTLIEEGPEPE